MCRGLPDAFGLVLGPHLRMKGTITSDATYQYRQTVAISAVFMMVSGLRKPLCRPWTVRPRDPKG